MIHPRNINRQDKLILDVVLVVFNGVGDMDWVAARAEGVLLRCNVNFCYNLRKVQVILRDETQGQYTNGFHMRDVNILVRHIS